MKNKTNFTKMGAKGKMKEPVAVIYCIRNKVNGFIYIGATTRKMERRFKEHVGKARWMRRYKRINPFLEDIKNFGSENFSIELVENIYDINIVAEIEDYWIKKIDKSKSYNSVKSTYVPNKYNSQKGGTE